MTAPDTTPIGDGSIAQTTAFFMPEGALLLSSISLTPYTNKFVVSRDDVSSVPTASEIVAETATESLAMTTLQTAPVRKDKDTVPAAGIGKRFPTAALTSLLV